MDFLGTQDHERNQFPVKQNISSSGTISSLSSVMQLPLPQDRLLSANFVITKFDPER
jgi:hypothetical protein